MRITVEEARTTAVMARLALPEAELVRMTGELDRILDYVAQLQEVDVTDVPPTTHAVDLGAPLRDDEVGEHLPVEAALLGAPRGGRQGDFFAVPAVFGDRGEG